MPARQLDEFMVGVVVHFTGRFKVRIASAEVLACFLVVRRVFWPTLVSVHGCSSILVCFQAPTTDSNECYMSHRRCAKDVCALVPGGLGGLSSSWSRA